MSLSVNGLNNVNMLQSLQRMQAQMQTLTDIASGKSLENIQIDDINQVQEVQKAGASDKVSAFGQMLEDAFEQVNNLQNDAGVKQARYDVGDRNVTLSDVMLATQKASLSFEATIQVRNKMIEAYRTISQMQI